MAGRPCFAGVWNSVLPVIFALIRQIGTSPSPPASCRLCPAGPRSTKITGDPCRTVPDVFLLTRFSLGLFLPGGSRFFRRPGAGYRQLESIVADDVVFRSPQINPGGPRSVFTKPGCAPGMDFVEAWRVPSRRPPSNHSCCACTCSENVLGPTSSYAHRPGSWCR